MKNLILMVLAATLTTSAWAQTKPAVTSKAYVVKGQIQGLTQGKIYFGHPIEDGFATDSMMTTNGHFLFKGTLPNPGICSIWIPEKKFERVLFFMDGGTVTVNAQQETIGKATITGSPLDVLYKEHRRELEGDVFAKLSAIEKKYNALKASPKAKLPDSLVKQQDVEVHRQFIRADSITRSFITSHSNSVIAPYLALTYYSVEPETAKLPVIYAALTPEVKNSYHGQKIKQLMSDLERVGIGKSVPNFTLADTTGKAVSLSSVKAKYVLVDFWASWCGPCRKENPNVVSAYKKFHDKGFEIVGVSLDTKKNAWEKAINADELSWYHVSDLKGWKSSVLEPFVVKVVPTSYLLDQDGKIVAKNLRGEALHRKLAELLDPKP